MPFLLTSSSASEIIGFDGPAPKPFAIAAGANCTNMVQTTADFPKPSEPPSTVMQAALQTVESLLRKYGHVYGANLAEIARRHYARDPLEACRELNNDEWWGDRDAIAAFDLALDGGFSPEARADGDRLRAALEEIYATMKGYGEQNAQGEIMVSQFNKWRTSRI
jgi:hypothetical protein